MKKKKVKSLSGQAMTDLPVAPRVVQCRLAKATESHWPSYAHLYAEGTTFGRINPYALERNKYAPWGRGAASGLKM